MGMRVCVLAVLLGVGVTVWAAPPVTLAGASALSVGQQVKVDIPRGHYKVGDRIDLIDKDAGAVVQCRVVKVVGGGQLVLKVIPEES